MSAESLNSQSGLRLPRVIALPCGSRMAKTVFSSGAPGLQSVFKNSASLAFSYVIRRTQTKYLEAAITSGADRNLLSDCCFAGHQTPGTPPQAGAPAISRMGLFVCFASTSAWFNVGIQPMPFVSAANVYVEQQRRMNSSARILMGVSTWSVSHYTGYRKSVETLCDCSEISLMLGRNIDAILNIVFEFLNPNRLKTGPLQIFLSHTPAPDCS